MAVYKGWNSDDATSSSNPQDISAVAMAQHPYAELVEGSVYATHEMLDAAMSNNHNLDPNRSPRLSLILSEQAQQQQQQQQQQQEAHDHQAQQHGLEQDEKHYGAPVQPPHHQPPKRKLIAIACGPCQKRKSKCDGNRPSCSLCERRSTQCSYEFDRDVSRSQALKAKNRVLKQTVEDFQTLYSFLRTGSMEEITEIIKRIQTDVDLSETVKAIKDSSLLLSASGGVQNAPGSQRMDASVDPALSTGLEDGNAVLPKAEATASQ